MPGDKAIAHRALLLLAMSRGGGRECRVRGLPEGDDVAATLRVLGALGRPGGLASRGRDDLDCGDSGSTMRMAAGLLAGRPAEARLVGGPSLSRRPMERVAAPLRLMGAEVVCEGPGGRPPMRIRGGRLKGVDIASPVASAQVKTAVLLSALRAEGMTVFREPAPSRDHTERLLTFLGVRLSKEANAIVVEGGQTWDGRDLEVPGDPSSAAFFAAWAASVDGGRAEIPGLCLNPTRLGFADVLKRMGAKVEIRVERESCGEPVGTLVVEGRGLLGTHIGPSEVPSLIDELPALAIAATQAEGETRVEGAAELRVKESDRIDALARGLRALGAAVEERADGFAIRGPVRMRGAGVDCAGDHRIAMALAVAGALAEGETVVKGSECAAKSFPGFAAMMEAAGGV